MEAPSPPLTVPQTHVGRVCPYPVLPQLNLPATMYVKSESDCDFDINMEVMTDMETNLLREELFGNHCIPSGKWTPKSIFPPSSRHSLLSSLIFTPLFSYLPLILILFLLSSYCSSYLHVLPLIFIFFLLLSTYSSSLIIILFLIPIFILIFFLLSSYLPFYPHIWPLILNFPPHFSFPAATPSYQASYSPTEHLFIPCVPCHDVNLGNVTWRSVCFVYPWVACLSRPVRGCHAVHCFTYSLLHSHTCSHGHSPWISSLSLL